MEESLSNLRSTPDIKSGPIKMGFGKFHKQMQISKAHKNKEGCLPTTNLPLTLNLIP